MKLTIDAPLFAGAAYVTRSAPDDTRTALTFCGWPGAPTVIGCVLARELPGSRGVHRRNRERVHAAGEQPVDLLCRRGRVVGANGLRRRTEVRRDLVARDRRAAVALRRVPDHLRGTRPVLHRGLCTGRAGHGDRYEHVRRQ